MHTGKSTLLNSVFGTKFVEMDALRGRQQTTRGIWMARSPKIESQVPYDHRDVHAVLT